ncbi:hypothetical protein HYT02_03915 [Candidatus Gottesmanbacteria bacterium]|nr:hypothetical protein [Candidatus Gottesmanbacteria bacterium]
MDKDKKPVENKPNQIKHEHKSETNIPVQEPILHEEQPKKKNPLIIIAIVVIVLGLLWGGARILGIGGGSGSNGPAPTATPFLPPADPNIVVELIPLTTGQTVDLRISKIPADITSVEYELKYKTDKLPQGVSGTAQVEDGRVTRELTLGTCSSGACKYHTIPDGKGMLTIKFNSSKGATRFQKEFKLF